MPVEKIFLPWEEENWLNEVSSWIKVSLAVHDIEMMADPIQVHKAPWSVVNQIVTNKGPHYFKALCPVLKYEPEVTRQLSLWQPNTIQPVLEVDGSRGWMLMPDGGTTLRQILEKKPSLNYWKKILPQYAMFQQAMIPHQQALLALGVHDRRLQILPSLASKLAADHESLLVGQPEGLSVSEYETLNRVMPKLQTLCEALAQYKISETLQHDDFHDGNIFVVQNGFRFFDWAESFIAHPFFTLVVTLRSIAYRFNLEEDSSELNELTELYLKEWKAYASLKHLKEAFELASVIGRINRALTWQMVVSNLPQPYQANEVGAVPGWAQLFLEKITLYA